MSFAPTSLVGFTGRNQAGGGKEAGLAERVHPHEVRYMHATELAAEVVPVNVIRKQLAHANVSATSRYLDHIALGEWRGLARGRKWG